MKGYPDLKDFLTALPEGIRRKKSRKKPKVKRKKKKKPWDETVSDLNSLRIPKRKLLEKKELLRSKNQDIAQELIEQQKRKHFQLKSEKKEKDWEDEEARLERINRRMTYNPVVEAGKGESHSYRVQDTGYEDSCSDDYYDEEQSSHSEDLTQIKSRRITSDTRSGMLDNILTQLKDFLHSNEVERKKTSEFRSRALEIFEKQGEKIRFLEEEINRLRNAQNKAFTSFESEFPPQILPRVTSRPFNPPARVAQIPTQMPTEQLQMDNKISSLTNLSSSAPQNKAVEGEERYGLMGRSVF